MQTWTTLAATLTDRSWMHLVVAATYSLGPSALRGCFASRLRYAIGFAPFWAAANRIASKGVDLVAAGDHPRYVACHPGEMFVCFSDGKLWQLRIHRRPKERSAGAVGQHPKHVPVFAHEQVLEPGVCEMVVFASQPAWGYQACEVPLLVIHYFSHRYCHLYSPLQGQPRSRQLDAYSRGA